MASAPSPRRPRGSGSCFRRPPAQSRSGPPALFASWLVVRGSCSAADFAWDFCIDPTVSSERASTRARVWRGARLEAQRERPELSAIQGTVGCALLRGKAGPRVVASQPLAGRRRRGPRDWRQAGAGRMRAAPASTLARGTQPPAPETRLRSFRSGGVAKPVEVTGPRSTHGLRSEINPRFNPRADDTRAP